jgi:hypothetical protein
VSEVTNILVSFDILERPERLAAVNAWLTEHGGSPLADVWSTDACVGGPKRMEVPLHAGAYNHFEVIPFITFLRGLPWEHPTSVQVMVFEHQAERWSVIDVIQMGT